MAKKKITKKNENAVQRFYRETVGELRKVTWPTREEAISLTRIVLIVMTAMSLFLFTMDTLFSRLIGLLLGL